MRAPRAALICALPLLATVAGAELGGDAKAGEQVFRRCIACHQVGPDARHRTGPQLNDILGAPAASQGDYRYSPAMAKAGAEELIWTAEALNRFLASPRAYMPGTKMGFRGLAAPEDRADVIAYLASFSEGTAAPQAAGFALSPEVLALDGDAEYGAYLAAECTTCHQADGDNDGIPAIINMQQEAFVTAMHAYKQKHRANPAMQLIASRLGDEEIAALAAHFTTLGN
ncbi:c-type cytochrome [Poseidonocella sedimentorum]|uniref:Cytochrome c n=1 Tax=Poseidonocella sedimentorum TaxID=871652 RepID=A0A1I6DV62_9RHOB|nr:c-type cytochrome [Poseidonocella sedimentorum]SFR09400.1 cytochrome c [Poseidonocella sedimentorum]